MALGVEEIPVSLSKITYPLEQVASSQSDVDDWQSLIDRGLVIGRIESFRSSQTGTLLQKVVVESEAVPWIRAGNIGKVSRAYESVHSGSLDSVRFNGQDIPGVILFDEVAMSYYMAGRWNEWLQKFGNTPRGSDGRVKYPSIGSEPSPTLNVATKPFTDGVASRDGNEQGKPATPQDELQATQRVVSANETTALQDTEVRNDPDAVFHIEQAQQQAIVTGDVERLAQLDQAERIARSIDKKTAESMNAFITQALSEMPRIQAERTIVLLSETERIQQETDMKLTEIDSHLQVDLVLIKAYYSWNYDKFFQDQLGVAQTQWKELTEQLAANPNDPELLIRRFELFGEISTLKGALDKMQEVIAEANQNGKVVSIQDFQKKIGLPPPEEQVVDAIQVSADLNHDKASQQVAENEIEGKISEDSAQREQETSTKTTNEMIAIEKRKKRIAICILAYMGLITSEEQKAALRTLLTKVQNAETEDVLKSAFQSLLITI